MYLIRVMPGSEPHYFVIQRSGAPLPVDPNAILPTSVLEQAAWLSALADKRPLPEGPGPHAVISPACDEDAFVAVVAVKAEKGDP